MQILFEPILAIAMIYAMVRIAMAENLSGVVWCGVAILVMLGCYFISLQYGRVLIAGAITYGLMTGYKVIANK